MNRICKICGAPAEVARTVTLSGIDFTGLDALYAQDLIQCAAGHHYNEINEDESILLKEEED